MYQRTEQGSGDRRRGGDRRRKARAAFSRRRARAAAAPAPLALYNLSFVSMGTAAPSALLQELVARQLALTPDEARQALARSPSTLRRYVPQPLAYAACRALRDLGAEVVVTISHANCPRCGFGVACEGQQSGQGLVLKCRACSAPLLVRAQNIFSLGGATTI